MWKIIEEKEVWVEDEEAGPVPAIYLRFWKPNSGRGPGTGKTMEYKYSHFDPSFHRFWEVMG